MIESKLASVFVHASSLVIPAGDFDHLPRQLGCSLHRSSGRLELASEQPGCAIVFAPHGDRMTLVELSVHDDPGGRFMRDVVVALVLAYRGDLEATLEWEPAREEPRLRIVRGETDHPLLSRPPPESLILEVEPDEALVDAWLAVAEEAWREYRTRRGQGQPGEPDHQ